MQSVTSGDYPSHQIFPKKDPSIAKTIQIKTAKIRQMKLEKGVMQAKMGAKRQFAFVFEKCTKMHQNESRRTKGVCDIV